MDRPDDSETFEEGTTNIIGHPIAFVRYNGRAGSGESNFDLISPIFPWKISLRGHSLKKKIMLEELQII